RGGVGGRARKGGAARSVVEGGAQGRAPGVFVPFGWNDAVLPAGSPPKSAESRLIGFPSGSEAVTSKTISTPSVPVTVAGATTTGIGRASWRAEMERREGRGAAIDVVHSEPA